MLRRHQTRRRPSSSSTTNSRAPVVTATRLRRRIGRALRIVVNHHTENRVAHRRLPAFDLSHQIRRGLVGRVLSTPGHRPVVVDAGQLYLLTAAGLQRAESCRVRFIGMLPSTNTLSEPETFRIVASDATRPTPSLPGRLTASSTRQSGRRYSVQLVESSTCPCAEGDRALMYFSVFEVSQNTESSSTSYRRSGITPHLLISASPHQ